MENTIKILPCFSLEPNKISSFNRIFTPNMFTPDGSVLEKKAGNRELKRQFHNFTLSENAYRNLKRKINWLYYLSKSRTITTYNQKKIFNFRIAFITLTLPSKQQHPTVVITKKLFNQFLTEIRQRTKMENYVWRLEFQKNKNVHYHLVTDSYIDYQLIKKVWNRILLNYGYIEPYTQKFGNLTLSEYNNLTNANRKTDFNIIKKRYLRGKLEKWKNPNTVDIKSVVSKKKIANYISKYFGKNPSEQQFCNDLDNEHNSKNLRLWFCSRSLSKLNSITDFSEAVEIDWISLASAIKKVRKVVFKYAVVFYFEFTNCIQFESNLIHKTLKSYAEKQGYNPALLV